MHTDWGPREWGLFGTACLLSGLVAAAIVDRLLAPSIGSIVAAGLLIFGGAA